MATTGRCRANPGQSDRVLRGRIAHPTSDALARLVKALLEGMIMKYQTRKMVSSMSSEGEML